MSLHVVHVITDGGIGGAQAYVRDVAIEQVRRGHRVEVIAGTNGALTQSLIDEGVETTVLSDLVRQPSAAHDVRAVREFREVFRRADPDVAHCHSSKAGLVGRIAARHERVPSVYTAHGWPFRHGGFFAQRALSFAGECFAARVGDHVICVSDEETEFAARWHVVPRRKLSTVHVGLPDRGPVEEHVARERPNIVAISRFARPKLPVLVVEALALVRDLDWSCQIAGDGPLVGDVRDAIEAHDLMDRIELLGTVSEPERLLASADVFLLLSRSEGMPVSVLEAMRAGVPVVCSDLPGVRLELDGGNVGLLTSNEPDAAAQAIRSLLDSPDLHAHLAHAARARFETMFLVEHAVDRIEAVYRSITQPR